MCKQLSQNMYQCQGTCGAAGTIWGTQLYTGDSNVYVAAKHAGLVPGIFTKIDKGPKQSFSGSSQNGVVSLQYGPFQTSYILVPVNDTKQITHSLFESFKTKVTKEVQHLKNQLLFGKKKKKPQCRVCNVRAKNYMCMPCNHISYCEVCIKAVIQNGSCTTCHQQITGHLKVYI